jgi:hypothetical protein
MPFKHSHVSSVAFCLEIKFQDRVEVMVIETDLHLNSRHPDYNELAVQQLIEAGQAYLIERGHAAAMIRLACNRSGEI